MNILLYGATGSIGDSLFSVVRKNKKRYKIIAGTCNTNFLKLGKLKKEFNIKKVGINNARSAERYKVNFKNKKNLFIGNDSFSKLITSDVDIIILAISGLGALDICFDIFKSGKIVGLANKECIISLGPRLIKLAKKYNTKIIPLDSEHNSIFRLLALNSDFKSITITASGGPFLNKSINQLHNVKPDQAIKHPIWKMGKKISVDSATMMNKALEIIEAKYLFNLKANQINAVIHPESIIHAAVNYNDNTSISLLNKPDMRIPISYLLQTKDHKNEYIDIFNYLDKKRLTFFKINNKKYPAIKLAYKVLELGGIAPHIFNYNNEVLVSHFLNNNIKFVNIVKYNEITLKKFFRYNKNIRYPNLKDIHNSIQWINKNIFLG